MEHSYIFDRDVFSLLMQPLFDIFDHVFKQVLLLYLKIGELPAAPDMSVLSGFSPTLATNF